MHPDVRRSRLAEDRGIRLIIITDSHTRTLKSKNLAISYTMKFLLFSILTVASALKISRPIRLNGVSQTAIYYDYFKKVKIRI